MNIERFIKFDKHKFNKNLNYFLNRNSSFNFKKCRFCGFRRLERVLKYHQMLLRFTSSCNYIRMSVAVSGQ